MHLLPGDQPLQLRWRKPLALHPCPISGAMRGAFPGTATLFENTLLEEDRLFISPSQWVLGEKRARNSKKYVGELKIEMVYAAQKWVKKGTNIRTKGSERVCLLVHGSESCPKHSFVTKSEFKIVRDWGHATKLCLVPSEVGIHC